MKVDEYISHVKQLYASKRSTELIEGVSDDHQQEYKMLWFRRLLLDHLIAFAPPGILRIPSSTFHTSKHSPHPSQAVGTRYKVTKLIKTQTQMIIHFPITHYMKAYKTCIRLFNCQLIRVRFRNVISFLININEEKKRNGKQKESIICACNIKQDVFIFKIC